MDDREIESGVWLSPEESLEDSREWKDSPQILIFKPQRRPHPRYMPRRESHPFAWLQQQYWIYADDSQSYFFWSKHSSEFRHKYVTVCLLILLVIQISQTLHVQNRAHFFSQILILNSVNESTLLPMTQARKQGRACFCLSCPKHQQEMWVPSPTYVSALATAPNLRCRHPNLITRISRLDRCNCPISALLLLYPSTSRSRAKFFPNSWPSHMLFPLPGALPPTLTSLLSLRPLFKHHSIKEPTPIALSHEISFLSWLFISAPGFFLLFYSFCSFYHSSHSFIHVFISFYLLVSWRPGPCVSCSLCLPSV